MAKSVRVTSSARITKSGNVQVRAAISNGKVTKTVAKTIHASK